jgi:DNA-binding transcriptional LysR family regulator
MRRHAEHLFREAGRDFRFTTMADVEASMRSLVASGMGAGILRLDQALEAQREGAAAIWPHWRARATLCWIARKGDESPPLSAVRECVREAWERAAA